MRTWRRRRQHMQLKQSHHTPDELASDDSRLQSLLLLDEEEEAVERIVDATRIPGDWESALEEFRRAWKIWTRNRGDAIRAPQMLKELDATVFITLEVMLQRKLHERADTHIRHMDKSDFWKINSLDLWGLFGITGCVKSFLSPLTKTGSLASLCSTAEEAIIYLKQARDMRRRGEVSAGNRAVNAEWAPQDIPRAIELVKQAKPSSSTQRGEPPPTPSTSTKAQIKPRARPSARASTAAQSKPSSSKRPITTAKSQPISSKQPYTTSKTQPIASKHASAASKPHQPFTEKTSTTSKKAPVKQSQQKKKKVGDEEEPIDISSRISESSDLHTSEMEDADKDEDEQNGDEEDGDSTSHVTARRNGARIPTPTKGRGEAAAAGKAQPGEASPPSFRNFETRPQQQLHHDHNPNFRPLNDTVNSPTRRTQHTQRTNTYVQQQQYPQYPPSSPPRPSFSPLSRDDDDDDLRNNGEEDEDLRTNPTGKDKSYVFSDENSPLNEEDDALDEDLRNQHPPRPRSPPPTVPTAATASPTLRKLSNKRRCSTSFFTPNVAKKRCSDGLQPDQEAFDATTYEVTINALDDYLAFVARDVIYTPRGSLQEVESEIEDARKDWEAHLKDGGNPRQSKVPNVSAMLATFIGDQHDQDDEKDEKDQEDNCCILVWTDWAAKCVTLASPRGLSKSFQPCIDAAGLPNLRTITRCTDRGDAFSGHSAASMDNAWLASIIARLLTGNSKPSSTPSSALHVWSYTIYCVVEELPMTNGQHIGFQSKDELAREVGQEVHQILNGHVSSRRGHFKPYLDSLVHLCSALQDRYAASHHDACSLREEAMAIRKLIEHLPATPQDEPPEVAEERELIRDMRKIPNPGKGAQRNLQEAEMRLADLLETVRAVENPFLDDLNSAIKDAIASASVAVTDYEQAQRELCQEIASAASCLAALQTPDREQ